MNEFDIHKNDPMAIGLRKKRKEKEAMWDRLSNNAAPSLLHGVKVEVLEVSK